MPDIAMRFHKDFLAVSSGVEEILNISGQNYYDNLEFLSFVEPENIEDAYKRFIVPTGVPCVCLPTRKFTSAALRELNANEKLEDLIEAQLKIANSFDFQHLLFELGSAPLPLDPFSKNSLNHYKDQYIKTVKIAEGLEAKNSYSYCFDAWYLSGFDNVNKLKCALMGLAQTSTKPIFVSCYYKENLIDFISVANEFGAAVIGVHLDASQTSKFSDATEILKNNTKLPLLLKFSTDELDDSSTIDLLEQAKASDFNFAQSFSTETFPKTALLASL